MSATTGNYLEPLDRISEGTPCRLCMKKNDYYHNIFTSIVASQTTVEDALYDLVDLKVAVGDGLPATLCPLCLKKLIKFYDFRNICHKSDAELRKFSSRNNFRCFEGGGAADDNLGHSVETKGCIEDVIENNSQPTFSAQTTEIYLPVPDLVLPRDNELFHVKEEKEDQLSEGNYPLLYTSDPAGISTDASDPLASDDLSIQGEDAADEKLVTPAETNGCIRDVIEGTSHLTCSVQRTEIYIPVLDSQQPGANMLETVKDENKDPLSEGNYPEIYTPEPAKFSRNAFEKLAFDELSDIGTCGSSSVKADQFSDDGGGYTQSNSTNGATNDLVSQAFDQPTVMKNGELIQNHTLAMVSMLEAEESPAPGRASALFSVLEPKIRASNSRKGKEVMHKDINKRDSLLADKITSCSIPNDGQLHSKCRYAYKITGDRATMIISGEKGGCDNAETMKFFRSTENGNNSPETIIGENKVKSTCMIKYPGKRARSTKKSYHCFICRDVFNAKHDLIIHLKIHFGSGKLDIDSNLSVGKDLSLKTVVSSRETNSPCQPISSKSLNQLMCKSQGVKQKGNRLLKENFLETRENKSVEEVRRSFIVDGKSFTVSPHRAKKPYSCGECDKSFSDKSNLVSHIRTHTKEKPYSCNECDKSFSLRCNLVSHIRTHTKEKPYSCNECDKSFSVRCNLVCHMRIHTKEKPFSCSQCDKSFSRKNTLVSHIRSHTKEKPYSCKECGKSYTSKQNLVLHMRVHRKEASFLQ